MNRGSDIMVYKTGVRHVTEFLREVDVLKGLSERHLDRISALCEETEFKEGDNLGDQDEPGHQIYIIRSGQIKATTGAQDKSLVVRTVREHETFPVAALFDPPIQITNARAFTDGTAFVIPRVKLIELCELEPRIGLHIYRAGCRILVSRYRYALNRLADEHGANLEISANRVGGEL